jgi:hypothetical protein
MSYAGPSAPKTSKARQMPLRQPVPLPDNGPSPIVFAAGLAVGIAVGAGIALLVAPRSGFVTRRRLARRGRKIARRGRDAWADLRDELHAAAVRRRRAKLVERPAATGE